MHNVATQSWIHLETISGQRLDYTGSAPDCLQCFLWSTSHCWGFSFINPWSQKTFPSDSYHLHSSCHGYTRNSVLCWNLGIMHRYIDLHSWCYTLVNRVNVQSRETTDTLKGDNAYNQARQAIHSRETTHTIREENPYHKGGDNLYNKGRQVQLTWQT